MGMEPSLKLARHVGRREGVVTVPYRDGEGWSIGAGEYMGKTPTRQSITVKEALGQIRPHLQARTKRVNDLINVPLKQHQFDAILDLYYQGGSDGLIAVAKIINARDPSDRLSVLASDREVCRELPNWDTDAAGNHLEGLLGRRGRNVAMYAAGEYGSDLDEIPMWDRVDPKTGKVRREDMKMVKVTEEDFA